MSDLTGSTISGAPDHASGSARYVGERRSAALALGIVVAARVVLGVWAAVVPAIRPPAEPAELVGSPYLGAPRLEEGLAGSLLAPWQRFDTQRYVRIAREGYAAPDDSHYPPLYPALIRAVAWPLGGGPIGRMIGALTVATAAAFGLFLLLHRLALQEVGPDGARLTVLLFATFPTSFFLFAGYSESLFIFLCLASFILARNGRFASAGGLGFLASMTRLTGWVLALPIAWEAWTRWRSRSAAGEADGSRLAPGLAAASLPVVATVAFLLFRRYMGWPPLDETFARYWARTPGVPGQDLVTSVNTLVFGGQARADQMSVLWVDFLSAAGMLIATPFVFRRFGVSHGLFMSGILFFLLLATSSVLPLYSVARYVLPLFPAFLLVAAAVSGRRLLSGGLVIGSFTLWLVFSAMFFSRNWVG